MFAEGMTALAAALSAAVVQAAGTDAWTAVRDRVAGVFGRGDGEVERAELERLDRTAATLDAAAPEETDRTRTRQEGFWQGRFEELLERLPEDERARAVAELRAVIGEQEGPSGVAGGELSGNVFHGPTAVQTGSHSHQVNHFGRGA